MAEGKLFEVPLWLCYTVFQGNTAQFDKVVLLKICNALECDLSNIMDLAEEADETE